MNATRQIGKHSNPSGISMKPLGDFIVTPPRFHSNPSAAVVKPASRPRRRQAGFGVSRPEIANCMAVFGVCP